MFNLDYSTLKHNSVHCCLISSPEKCALLSRKGLAVSIRAQMLVIVSPPPSPVLP